MLLDEPGHSESHVSPPQSDLGLGPRSGFYPMESWDAQAFVNQLTAGELNGNLAEALGVLSEEQLRAVLRLLAAQGPGDTAPPRD